MSLVASVVTYTVESSNAEELRRRVQDHLVPAAQSLPGYQGFLLLDQGEDRRIAILFFETPEQVHAAQAVLTPVGQEHTYALMSGPAVGSLARVLIADRVFGE